MMGDLLTTVRVAGAGLASSVSRELVSVRWLAVVGLGIAVLLGLPSGAAGCPTCRDALVHSGLGGAQLGFYWSILFMISMPFLIFGGWLVFIIRSVRGGDETGGLEPSGLGASGVESFGVKAAGTGR